VMGMYERPRNKHNKQPEGYKEIYAIDKARAVGPHNYEFQPPKNRPKYVSRGPAKKVTLPKLKFTESDDG
jgi:hypothetical protein